MLAPDSEVAAAAEAEAAAPLLGGAADDDGEARVFDDTGARVDDGVADDDGEAGEAGETGEADAGGAQHGEAKASAAGEQRPSRMRRAWRGVRWFGSKLWAVGMKVGNYSAHFLGLHDSKYQDVVDYYEHMREIQRQRILRELHAAAQRISEVEAGQVQMSHAVVQPPNDDDRMRFIARAAVAVDDPLSTSALRSSSPAPAPRSDMQQQQQEQEQKQQQQQQQQQEQQQEEEQQREQEVAVGEHADDSEGIALSETFVPAKPV